MVKPMPEQFVPRLRELLKEKNINQRQLCRMLGVSMNTVSEWCCGWRTMNAVLFMNLCKVLDVNPLWLYGETDERTSYGS